MPSATGAITAILAAIGLEALGVPVVSTLVDVAGQLVSALVSWAFGGLADVLNPANYF